MEPLNKHFKKHIGIYNILYTGTTTVALSGLIIGFNGTIPTAILVAIGVCAHNIINKLKDKICELDSGSQLGKYKSENEELKEKIGNKEAMLVALRAELINYSTKPNKRNKKEAEDLINGLLSWCGETNEMNTMNNVTQEHTTKQRDNIKKYIEQKTELEEP